MSRAWQRAAADALALSTFMSCALGWLVDNSVFDTEGQHLAQMRRVAARIPFASDALSIWWCARDPATPAAAKGIMFAALAYFVLPTDAIPDILAGIGFTDDAAVFAALLAVVGKNIKPHHRDAARAWLARVTADD